MHGQPHIRFTVKYLQEQTVSIRNYVLIRKCTTQYITLLKQANLKNTEWTWKCSDKPLNASENNPYTCSNTPAYIPAPGAASLVVAFLPTLQMTVCFSSPQLSRRGCETLVAYFILKVTGSVHICLTFRVIKDAV